MLIYFTAHRYYYLIVIKMSFSYFFYIINLFSDAIQHLTRFLQIGSGAITLSLFIATWHWEGRSVVFGITCAVDLSDLFHCDVTHCIKTQTNKIPV